MRSPLVRSIRRYVVPVYDYVLVTEPLSSGPGVERVFETLTTGRKGTAMIAFGGAGPVHGFQIARALGSPMLGNFLSACLAFGSGSFRACFRSPPNSFIAIKAISFKR